MAIIPAPLLNKAAKKLSPEKHSQIKEWAITLNSAQEGAADFAQKHLAEAVESPIESIADPPQKTKFKVGDYIQLGEYFGYLRAKNPKGLWLVDWKKSKRKTNSRPPGMVDESMIDLARRGKCCATRNNVRFNWWILDCLIDLSCGIVRRC